MIEEVVSFDRAAYNQGANAKYDPQYLMDGTVSTLVARGPGGGRSEDEPWNKRVVGALCAVDYKGVNWQYVCIDHKVIVQRER